MNPNENKKFNKLLIIAATCGMACALLIAVGVPTVIAYAIWAVGLTAGVVAVSIAAPFIAMSHYPTGNPAIDAMLSEIISAHSAKRDAGKTIA